MDLIAEDFEYAGEYLKDWNLLICRTDTPGLETITSDSQLSFKTNSIMGGKLFELVTAVYEDRIEITFQICKNPCPTGVIKPFSLSEERAIKRWLNRPTFHKFKLIQPNWADIYMEGSFNIKNIELKGQVYFFELTFISNRPFALHEPIIYNISTLSENDTFTFYDISDEIGYIYPRLKVKCLQAGDLRITNSNENRTTILKNCSFNEEIYFSPNLYIETTSPTHKVQDDFNYLFFRISNSYDDRKNALTFSIPVEAEITYSPYVKAVQ